MTNKSVLVLAFDPGQTTGYVILIAKSNEIDLLDSGRLIRWCGVPLLLSLRFVDYVVIENYRLFPHMLKVMANQTVIGAEVKGGILALAETSGFPLDCIIIQEPSERPLLSSTVGSVRKIEW